MNAKLVYLDSSSIVKRHVEEKGSEVIDAASKEASCNLFLSADDKLVQTAEAEGLKAINIEVDPEKALSEF